ncbi:hypothetical protein [Helicobacter pylori]|uniref:hypothetical protein n=1 Tax=Helicobacter pylori TaxID=210 RepID=UPI001FD13721|nr:hypothetical protein [Helicobacter pylori]UOR67187.1 hypothetical protein MPG40_04205 [Helicobacter pylori]
MSYNANDKKQAEAFDLQKRQADQSMDLAKRQQRMNEGAHRKNKRLNEQRLKAMNLDNTQRQDEYTWLKKATPMAKASVRLGNEKPTPTTQNALNTPTTPTKQSALPTQSTPIAKPAAKEEIIKNINSNPFFRY